MLVLFLFWLGGVAVMYGVGFAIEKQINKAQHFSMALVSSIIGLLPAYLLHKIGAEGTAANIVMLVLGFLAVFGIKKLYKIKNQA